MIDFLRGKVVHLEEDFIVLDVNGVGYRLFCANPYLFSGREEKVVVYVHHHVREDAIQLFGFLTREEQRLFRRLLDVSGIGPRVALGVMSGSDPATVVAAIRQENLSVLTKLPGIGKKTAQRMVLDLKDKLDGFDSFLPPASVPDSAPGAAPAGEASDGVWSEAKEGLKALGYTDAEANGALRRIRSRVDESESVDVVMKLALQSLYNQH